MENQKAKEQIEQMSLRKLGIEILLFCAGVILAVILSYQLCYADEDIDLLEDEKVLERVTAQEKGVFEQVPHHHYTSPLGDIQHAWDHADDRAGLRRVHYDVDKTIKLRLREKMLTTIIFPEWEEIGDIYLGDDYGFDITKTQKNVLVLRSKKSGVDTNLTVMGAISKAPYDFYLRSEGIHSQNISDNRVLIQSMPPLSVTHQRQTQGRQGSCLAGLQDAPYQEESSHKDPSKKVNHSEAMAEIFSVKSVDRDIAQELVHIANPPHEINQDYLQNIEVQEDKINMNYKMHGSKEIAPLSVFDDGLFTYFYYGEKWAHGDTPVIYRVIDKIDMPVNYRVVGSMIVIESLGNFTLKNGRRYTCIRRKEVA